MNFWTLGLALFGLPAAPAFDRLVGAADQAVVASAVESDLAAQDTRVQAAREFYSGKVTAFQREWLTEGHWEYVGTVERPDRRFNRPELCGETRVLYRLRHKGATLPAVANVVYEWLTTETCTEFWKHRPPLGRDWARLELNLQNARWADDGQGRFVDQVRYLLRVFRKEGGELRVAPLENSPDVERLAADPSLKAELAAWLRDSANAAAVARGFPKVPEKFLATVAESVTPFGLERLANRPFKTLFGGEGLSDDYLHRLDTLTCVGCHQNGAVAGFHFLGKAHANDGPALAEKFSPYFAAIQEWRETSLEDPSSLPDLSFPRTASSSEKDGDACETMTLSTFWHAEKDTQNDVQLAVCPRGGVCASTTNGFPGGLCSSRCSQSEPGRSCEQVPTLGPFSTCRDEGGSFEACLGRHHQVTALAACAKASDCRPDYACILDPKGEGYCAPGYVLPHLNIEHH